MVAFISWLITRSVKARTGIDNLILLLLLAMMVAMLVGPAYLYLVTLNFTIGDVAIWEIAVFMSVGMMPGGVLLFAQYWMEGDPERKGPLPFSNLLRHVTGLRAAYILLLLLSEILMGWTFDLASGLVSLSEGYTAASAVRASSPAGVATPRAASTFLPSHSGCAPGPSSGILIGAAGAALRAAKAELRFP